MNGKEIKSTVHIWKISFQLQALLLCIIKKYSSSACSYLYIYSANRFNRIYFINCFISINKSTFLLGRPFYSVDLFTRNGNPAVSWQREDAEEAVACVVWFWVIVLPCKSIVADDPMFVVAHLGGIPRTNFPESRCVGVRVCRCPEAGMLLRLTRKQQARAVNCCCIRSKVCARWLIVIGESAL